MALALAACQSSESQFGPGLDQLLQVQDAQLRMGELEVSEGGPEVSQLLRPQPEVMRGEGLVSLSGRLSPGGVSLRIQAQGDPGYWVVRPVGFDFVEQDELLWSARLNFSYAIQGPTLPVRLQAVDAEGRGGPILETEFALSAELPPAELLISLGWDSPSDLDLAVRTPDGIVVSARNVNSFEPAPGQVPGPDAWMEGGFHDFDSNQSCDLDLRNRENVVWLIPPPPGRYQVFANLFSACGSAQTRGVVSVQVSGVEVTTGTATFYPIDARIPVREGDTPGFLLAEFDIP